MEDIRCYECNESTVVKEDYNEGDLICTECGLVLISHLVDVRQEWRTSELDLSSRSRARAEKPPDVFYKDAELFTTISMPKICIAEFGSNKNADVMNFERRYGVGQILCRFEAGINVISTMADKLALLKVIVDRAKDIYKTLKELKSLHRVNSHVAAGACLYVACQLEKYARTFKEIIAVAGVPIQMRAIARTSRKIHQELQELNYEIIKGESSPSDYVKRFCSRLQMNQTDVRATLETVANLEKKWDIRRKPTTLIAATIFMVTQLSSDKRNLAEISKATDVSEKTISDLYKEISPFAKEMVPQWFHN